MITKKQNFLQQKELNLSKRLFSHIVLGGDSEIILANIAYEENQPDLAFDLLKTTADSSQTKKRNDGFF